MKGCLRFIAQFLAVICAIFFIISAMLAIVFFNLESRLFDPDTYKAALEERRIYETLPGILSEEIALSMNYDPCKTNPMLCEIEGASDEYLACLEDALGQKALEEIGTGKRLPTEAESNQAKPCIDLFGGTPRPENVGEGGPPQFFKSLEPEDWEFILTTLLPPDDSKLLIETALDQVFAYLDGDSDMAVIPLGQLKARLTGPEGIEVVERLIAAQPACSEDELARMKAFIEETLEGQMILCNPPEDDLLDMLPRLQEQLFRVATDIPDEAILIQSPDPGSTGGPIGKDFDRGLTLARTILRLSPLIPLGFLILVTLFAVRSLKGWLLWWGVPFLIVGVFGVVVGLLIAPLLQFAWTSFIQFPPYMSPTLAELALELLTSIVQSISKWVVVSAILLAVLGVGAIIGSRFVRIKRNDAGVVPA